MSNLNASTNTNVQSISNAAAHAAHSSPVFPEKEEQNNQATQLLAFVKNFVSLFHDESGKVYAHDKITGENRRVDSQKFRDWLFAKYYRENGKALRDQAFREAESTLLGIGRFDSECHPVFIRIAKFQNCYYIDLAESGNSRAVCVSAGSWQVVDKPHVRFLRNDNHRPLPIPASGGDIQKLWNIANIPTQTRLLAIAWMINSWMSDTPHLVLELFGEQGSAKSTTQKSLRQLIDPNTCDLRSAPKSRDDLFVSAHTAHVISLENLSSVNDDLQDALCLITTGGSDGKRKNYSDYDECSIAVKNPVVLNGIGSVVTRQDLVDRTISINLPTIKNRQDINHLEQQFEQNKPEILGALLDLFASALTLLPTTHIPEHINKPRMLEYTRLGLAIATAMGYSSEKFLEQYLPNRQEAIDRGIEDSPVAQAVINYFTRNPNEILSTQLQELLTLLGAHKPTHCIGWPKTERALGNDLRRQKPALRQEGIEVISNPKIGGKILWEIKRI